MFAKDDKLAEAAEETAVRKIEASEEAEKE